MLTPVAKNLPELAPLSILVADDSAVNRIYISKLLGRMGHRITEAVDGRNAIDAWLREEFDLVLMDIQMPGVDGLTAMKTIRVHETSRKRYTPIIAVTAHILKDDCEKLLLAGFDGYAAKPVTAEALVGVIKNCLAASLHSPERVTYPDRQT